MWPGKTTHGLLHQVISHCLEEIKLVLDERPGQKHARTVVRNTHDVAALDARRRKEVVEFEVPSVRRRLGLNRGQSTGEAAKLSPVRTLEHVKRFDRINRQVYGKSPRNRIDGFRKINQQKTL